MQTFLNPQAIYNNTKYKITEEIEGQKTWWSSGFPYAVLGTVFWGLSDLALSQPETNVIWTVSKCLDAGMIGCVCKGAFELIKALDAQNNPVRKVEYIKIPKQEFEAMQSEILFLRQRQEELNLLGSKSNSLNQ